MPAITARRSGSRSAALPQLASFECGGCGTIHQSPDAEIPVGWSTCRGIASCPDCTRVGIPARTIARAKARGGHPRRNRRAA
ncbi:hypothetical protein [Novosphingobium sp.]|uniref:hypothetical protein n=1 Tax=Novosphingobium sp. TaxID=1874826 RepID=UPI0038BDD2E3